MVHLVIAGHGKQRNGTFDPGATGYIKKGEHKYVVEDLFPAMKRHLPKGHDVVFFDKYKVSNYGNIVSLAREYKATQITEIHFDASSSESARGGHVIVHKSYSPDKTDLALRDAIKTMVGVRYSHKGHEGISGRNNLYNVNATAKAGITYRLIELGFGSNRKDAEIMTKEVDAYARELVKAITGGKVSGASNAKPSKPATSNTASKPVKTSPSKVEKLAVDGYWGPATTRALQRYFGTTVDGVISGQPNNASVRNIPSARIGSSGSILIRTMQRYFKSGTIDGKISNPSQLISAMQRRYGTTVDGHVSKQSLLVKELQRRLNEGKKL